MSRYLRVTINLATNRIHIEREDLLPITLLVTETFILPLVAPKMVEYLEAGREEGE